MVRLRFDCLRLRFRVQFKFEYVRYSSDRNLWRTTSKWLLKEEKRMRLHSLPKRTSYSIDQEHLNRTQSNPIERNQTQSNFNRIQKLGNIRLRFDCIWQSNFVQLRSSGDITWFKFLKENNNTFFSGEYHMLHIFEGKSHKGGVPISDMFKVKDLFWKK